MRLDPPLPALRPPTIALVSFARLNWISNEDALGYGYAVGDLRANKLLCSSRLLRPV